MTVAPPSVSILIPVWDPDPRQLRLALQSLLAQTMGDFEILVLEDPGPRSSADVVAALDDPRIRFLRRPERTRLGEVLNDAMETLARAPLIARMDADDIAEPTRLEKQVAFLRAHPEVSLVGTRITVIDEHDRAIGARDYPTDHDAIAAALQLYNCFSHPSVIFRRDAALAVGGYRAGILNEDYDLWCKMVVAGMRLANLPERLLRYRYHAGAQKRRTVHEVIRVTMAIKEEHFGGRLSPGARLRLLAERALLRLPEPLIVEMFRRLEYGPARRLRRLL